MHLTDYLWVLKRRVLLILFFWGLVFASVVVATFMQQPLYRAYARIEIERSVDTPDVIEAGARRMATEEFYNSQVENLRSRRIARKLYNDMGMYNWEYFRKLGPDRDPIAVVRNWIRVSRVPKTHHVEIWVLWPDPKMAARMVNAVTDAYTDILKEWRSSAFDASVRALLNRAQDIKREQDKASRAVQDFSAEREIYALPEIRSVVLTNERWLQEAAAQANVEMIAAQSLYDAVNKAVEEGTYENTRDTDLLQRLRERLYAYQEIVELEKEDKTRRYRDQDRLSRNMEVRVEQVNQQIAVENDRMRRAAQSDAAQKLATAQANYEFLSDMLLTNRQRLTQISRDMLQLEGLRKQQENIEEMRAVLDKAAETVKTYRSYEDIKARVISQADIPKGKFSPNPALNLPLGLVVGLMVGIIAAFFFEYLNTTIRMPRDIEDGLGLPVLGFVPAMSPKFKDFATRSLISHLDSRSGPAEAFRGIRTEVMLRSDLRQVKTGMVTSTSPQEGKTTVAVNWAITLAQAGNKVLLIDGDLRKPMIHRAFNMKPDRGLSTLLSEKDSATVYIKKTDIENLHVLPGGPIPSNPAELLGSRKMRTLVAEAAERYDSVIIDASPVLGVADANILSTMVDCVVLVVQASKNRRGLVMRAKNQLASVNARLAGAVLNNVRGTKGDYYYYRQRYQPVAEMMEEAGV